MSNKYFVRYPVGFNHRSECEYCILDKDSVDKKLDYVESRRQIYIPTYCNLAKEETEFFPELQERLRNGENLLIIEPDGPHQESLDHYKKTWFVDDNFITNSTMLINDENLTAMVFDMTHHLAMALLDIDVDLLDFWDTIEPI